MNLQRILLALAVLAIVGGAGAQAFQKSPTVAVVKAAAAEGAVAWAKSLGSFYLEDGYRN